MKNILGVCLFFLLFSACATKKEILYLQDANNYPETPIDFASPKIQPNDILKIDVGALIPETALPYNNPVAAAGGMGGVSPELLQLQGYLVSEDNSINFPQLGNISTKDKTVIELQNYLQRVLEDGGHLRSPTVNVRLLNAKVTILGEVNQPGTFTYTEFNITLLQALGYAGDLSINGKREDIILLRETDGNRVISHVDITSTDFIKSDAYLIKPNDIIIVNPNGPRVKSAGFVGNTSAFISVFSIILTTVLLITR